MEATRPYRELIERHYLELLPFLDGDCNFSKFGCYDPRAAQKLFAFVSKYLWRDNPDFAEVLTSPASN